MLFSSKMTGLFGRWYSLIHSSASVDNSDSFTPSSFSVVGRPSLETSRLTFSPMATPRATGSSPPVYTVGLGEPSHLGCAGEGVIRDYVREGDPAGNSVWQVEPRRHRIAH